MERTAVAAARALAPESSSAEIEAALAQWPENFVLHERLGDALTELCPRRALQAYRRALELEPRAEWLRAKIERAELVRDVTPGKDAVKVVRRIQPDGDVAIGLVTCVRDREENLVRTLPTWLALPKIDEVLIVDWTSRVPVSDALARAGIEDPRLRIVRVEGEPRWILSHAFNLGFRMSRGQLVMKVDADIELSPDVLEANPVPEGSFVAGDWRAVEDPHQSHLNGTVFVRRPDLASVGGYNEYLTTYGYDDNDLYQRLVDRGLERRLLDARSAHHLPHDDDTRVGRTARHVETVREALLRRPQVHGEKNRLIVSIGPRWAGYRKTCAYVRSQDDGIVRVWRDGISPSEMAPDVAEGIERLALRRVLSWQHGPVVFTISDRAFDALLDRPHGTLQTTDFGPKRRAPASILRRKTLYVDAQHGLGNRMRAIGSVAAVAEKLGRDLVIVWAPDDHCDCRFADLFATDMDVVDHSFADRAVSDGMQLYNAMEAEGGHPKRPFVPDLERDIYVRTQSTLATFLSEDADANRFLRALEPVAAVQDLVAQVPTPNDLSLHVRMIGGAGDEHLSYEDRTNWAGDSHLRIASWRRNSHVDRFVPRVDALMSEEGVERIFVAADRAETYDVLRERFGDRMAYLRRDLYDRSAAQLRYALADAILLGRSPRLLGSGWSSFTELAIRLSPGPIRCEISGVDF